MEQIGFSETEAKVSLFLVFALIIGAATYYIRAEFFNHDYKDYDYSTIDSVFLSKEINNKQFEDSIELADETVDYKAELLDFRENEIKFKSDSSTSLKIDINSADFATLIKLPGIGKKTAQRIIKFRDARKKLVNLDELLEVKGIGKTKLKELKKFLIIE